MQPSLICNREPRLWNTWRYEIARVVECLTFLALLWRERMKERVGSESEALTLALSRKRARESEIARRYLLVSKPRSLRRQLQAKNIGV